MASAEESATAANPNGHSVASGINGAAPSPTSQDPIASAAPDIFQPAILSQAISAGMTASIPRIDFGTDMREQMRLRSMTGKSACGV